MYNIEGMFKIGQKVSIKYVDSGDTLTGWKEEDIGIVNAVGYFIILVQKIENEVPQPVYRWFTAD